jgi:hypothetical protein
VRRASLVVPTVCALLSAACVGPVPLPLAPLVVPLVLLDGAIQRAQGEDHAREVDVWDLAKAMPGGPPGGIDEVIRRLEEAAPATRGRLRARDSGTLRLRRSPAADAQLDAWLAAERARLGLSGGGADGGPPP